MRRYNANGTPKGNAVEFPDDEARYNGFAMDDAGNGVLVFERGQDIYAQAYDPGGDPVGSAFGVNTHTEGEQDWASVAVNDAGECLIAWRSDHDNVGTGHDIFARAYDSVGVPLGDEFRISTHTEGETVFSADVALNNDGRLAVVWYSTTAADGYDIFAQVGTIREPNGDLNGDGFVGQGDLDIILAQWGRSGLEITDPRADVDGDDFIGQYDLDNVLESWGQGTPPPSVPEPATLSLLTLASLALMRRERK